MGTNPNPANVWRNAASIRSRGIITAGGRSLNPLATRGSIMECWLSLWCGRTLPSSPARVEGSWSRNPHPATDDRNGRDLPGFYHPVPQAGSGIVRAGDRKDVRNRWYHEWQPRTTESSLDDGQRRVPPPVEDA